MDGPNYEKVFRDMKVFHGGNQEDVKHIVRYLRFFQGTEEFSLYAKHYVPMLPAEFKKEFGCDECGTCDDCKVPEVKEVEPVADEKPKKKTRFTKKS